jgi:hypothetical protein
VHLSGVFITLCKETTNPITISTFLDLWNWACKFGKFRNHFNGVLYFPDTEWRFPDTVQLFTDTSGAALLSDVKDAYKIRQSERKKYLGVLCIIWRHNVKWRHYV